MPIPAGDGGDDNVASLSGYDAGARPMPRYVSSRIQVQDFGLRRLRILAVARNDVRRPVNSRDLLQFESEMDSWIFVLIHSTSHLATGVGRSART